MEMHVKWLEWSCDRKAPGRIVGSSETSSGRQGPHMERQYLVGNVGKVLNPKVEPHVAPLCGIKARFDQSSDGAAEATQTTGQCGKLGMCSGWQWEPLGE